MSRDETVSKSQPAVQDTARSSLTCVQEVTYLKVHVTVGGHKEAAVLQAPLQPHGDRLAGEVLEEWAGVDGLLSASDSKDNVAYRDGRHFVWVDGRPNTSLQVVACRSRRQRWIQFQSVLIWLGPNNPSHACRPYKINRPAISQQLQHTQPPSSSGNVRPSIPSSSTRPPDLQLTMCKSYQLL